MKSKLSILFLLATFIATGSFAQDAKKQNARFPVIVAESGIKNITASSNIDLLLLNAESDEVKTSVPTENLDDLKISYTRGNLKLGTKRYMDPKERIPVYVYVNELESLNLSGNAFARSRDVLDLGSLKINIQDEAKVALKSKGKVRVNAPENYHMLEEERYHIILSTEE